MQQDLEHMKTRIDYIYDTLRTDVVHKVEFKSFLEYEFKLVRRIFYLILVLLFTAFSTYIIKAILKYGAG